MDDMRVVLDAAGSQRAVILGQGHGGTTCILFAGTYPDRVWSLVLADTYARWLRDVDYPAGMPADTTIRYRDAVRRAWGGSSGSATDVTWPSTYPAPRTSRCPVMLPSGRAMTWS